MKKLLLLNFVLITSLCVMSQNRPLLPSCLKNVSEKKKIEPVAVIEPQSNQINLNNDVKILNDLQIGTTSYDLQTNDCVDSRCYLFPDGTIGTTWIFGTTPPSYAERGTGYNYFDGTNWLPDPTARVEAVKTGWPSYAPIGVNQEGEIFIAHASSTSSLVMNKRDTKGTGPWTQTALPYTPGSHVFWPRVCTSGNTIHVIASDNDTNVVLNGMKSPMYYYRSQDGGATWDINQVIPAGLETYTKGFGGDEYAWAKPQGNTIAFVVGDMPSDIVLMKSTDAGTTWTKTIVFQNPHPYFDFSVPTDTMYTTDGHLAVELDASGNAHVVFGIKRILNVSATSYSVFTLVNGMGIWNEGEPTYTGINGLNVDTLYNQGKLIAWVQDRNGDGVLFDNFINGTTIMPTYRYGAPISQPQLSIDANGDMYLVYTSAVEDQITGSGVYYNHLWGRKYYASEGAWGQFVELTAGNPTDYDFVEMVYPALSKTMDNKLHIVYQYDFEPGAYTEPYVSPGTIAGSQNVMMYLTMDKSDLILNRNEVNLTTSQVNIYPNPVADYMDVSFAFNKTTTVTMNIYNAVGSLVNAQEIVVGRGETSHINTSNLSTGIYLVKFETENGTFSKKIVKK